MTRRNVTQHIEKTIKTTKKIITIITFCYLRLVSSIKYVDSVIAQESMNKLEMWEKLKFDVVLRELFYTIFASSPRNCR